MRNQLVRLPGVERTRNDLEDRAEDPVFSAILWKVVHLLLGDLE